MNALFRALDDSARAGLRPRRQPAWIDPMLATLTDKHFSDPEWIFERKLDGVRCLGFRNGDRTRLLSRNKLDMTSIYPEVASELARQKAGNFILDGEIVAMDGKATSFSRLQGRLGVQNPTAALRKSIPVHFYVFDILYLGGMDVTALPVVARKQLLEKALRFRDPLVFTEHRREKGLPFLKEACRVGWEGLIAKRADAPYVSRRSRDWLKFKCTLSQELVIAGYTDPAGARQSFGALLVGYYDHGTLKYAGKVGTGFDHATLQGLGRRLQKLETARCPFAPAPRVAGAHWTRPSLVGQFGFNEWTSDGKLRHPRFEGLRIDKKAKDVRRERPTG